MKIDPLIKMANEIAAFFEGEGGLQQGPQMVATHISRYWEKRMRQEIIAYYQQRGGEGLDEVALKAVAILASDAPPVAQQGQQPSG